MTECEALWGMNVKFIRGMTDEVFLIKLVRGQIGKSLKGHG